MKKKDYDSISAAEAARMLNVPPQMVREHLKRGKGVFNVIKLASKMIANHKTELKDFFFSLCFIFLSITIKQIFICLKKSIHFNIFMLLYIRNHEIFLPYVVVLDVCQFL